MNRGTTISLYLVDGDPSGIICAYLSNWTGQARGALMDKAEMIRKKLDRYSNKL